MTSTELKANFAVQNKYGAFFTGGEVKFSKDGETMFCQCGNTVKVLDVKTCKQTSMIGQEDDDEITHFEITPDDQFLVVASRCLLLKKWNWRENVVVRTWKAIHTGPISSMAFDVTSTLLATGGADATIKVWDTIKQYCTHNLKGHSGVVSVVAYHPDISRLQLFSAGDDYNIRVWDLQTSTCKVALEGHYSVITSLQFSPDGSTLYSGGRDNVVIVWDATTLSKSRTIPVFDTVESLVVLPEGDYSALNIRSDNQHFITGGAKGILRVWDSQKCCCVYPATEAKGEEDADEAKADSAPAITSVAYHKELNTINVVTYDHNIYLRNLPDLSIQKQFVGYNDDVLDMAFCGENDCHLVVATNSELLKVFEVATWNCQILRGHTDIVLCIGVAASKTVFATGSKDNTIRVWQMHSESKAIICVAIGNGHTHAVNSISFPRMKDNFLVSGSHDCTLKVWELPEQYEEGHVLPLTSKATEHAHEKEINAVCVTPNDKLIASGSQDKTAKLWTSKGLSLLGVFRGHKRSIWSMEFSPVDQVLATASADTSIKIWALSDFSCVKTFEGHQSSVLRIHFITRGMQLVSSGSDGMLKLWTIKSNECIGTWDEHEEKVWALAVTKDELNIATGAGDSTICLWKDITEEEQRESLRKQEEFILQEQKLSNLLLEKKFLKALKLAITLNQPFRVLNIMKEVLDGENGREEAASTLKKLRDDQMDTLLGFCTAWNTNSKNCHVAQYVVQHTLTSYSPEDLMKLGNIRSTIEALIPYTERHFQRMNRLQQQSTFVDYTWQSMKPVSNVLGEETLVGTSTSKPMDVDADHQKASDSDSDEAEDQQPINDSNAPADESSSSSSSSSEDSDSESELESPEKTVKHKPQKSDSSKKEASISKSNISVSSSDDSESESEAEPAMKAVKHKTNTSEGSESEDSESENEVDSSDNKDKEEEENGSENSSSEEEEMQPKKFLRRNKQKVAPKKISSPVSDKENQTDKDDRPKLTKSPSNGSAKKASIKKIQKTPGGKTPISTPGSTPKRRKSTKMTPSSAKRPKL